MIAEWIMERHGWEAVWFLGSNRPHPHWWQFVNHEACYVGTWTGPQLDLICVKPCKTNREANRYLSPPGYTITDAAIRSWLNLRRLRRA